jgi:Holliday junction resolvasome RuvABC endonuclease subunit
MTILAIDPGTACGWAVRHSATDYDSGVWDLSAKRHEGGGMRFLRCRQAVREAIRMFKPTIVAYEEVRRHMGVDAAHVYGGIVAVISSECEAHDPPIPYRGFPVGTVKKLATGKGNADKAAMLAAARLRWPAREWDDDNEADARFIAETAAKELG